MPSFAFHLTGQKSVCLSSRDVCGCVLHGPIKYMLMHRLTGFITGPVCHGSQFIEEPLHGLSFWTGAHIRASIALLHSRVDSALFDFQSDERHHSSEVSLHGHRMDVKPPTTIFNILNASVIWWSNHKNTHLLQLHPASFARRPLQR